MNDNSNVKENSSVENLTLERKLGLREATTITVGTVVGVGIFTVGSSTVGTLTGGSVILATLLAFIVSIFPSLIYGEMGGSLPYAGGTYSYAKRALGKPIATVVSWHYIIAIVCTAAGESLAFAYYFSWIFKGAGINFDVDPRIIAGILAFLFIFINYRGVELSGKVQNLFVFFFWIASAVWMLYMVKNVSLDNFTTESFAKLPEFKEFVLLTTFIWWCFAGFETACGMGGEIKYPHINIPRSMKMVTLMIFAVNGLFQFFLTGLVPIELQSKLAVAEAPYALGLELAGYTGFPIILLCCAIALGGDLSTMNPGVAGPSRYMYQMGQDGILPKFFGKVHPIYKTPYISIIVTALLTYGLILTNSIVIIATISVCSIFWVYLIGFLSFYKLRKNEPDLKRPYKMPGASFGVIISVATYCLMLWSTGWYNIALSFIITAVALFYYYFWGRTHSESDEDLKAIMEKEQALLDEDIPSQEEKQNMDKQYKRWFAVSIIMVIVTILAYVVVFL